MVHFSITAVLAFAAATVLAVPQAIKPDPAGADKVGNGQNKQFITGGCLSSADCAVGVCCASIVGDNSIGVCSAVSVANGNGKGGCGFGDNGSGNNNPAPPSASAAPATGGGNNNNNNSGSAQCTVNQNDAGSQFAGTGSGQQFITGQCLSPQDCASGCCSQGANGGVAKCAARLVAEGAGRSCDFTCN